MSTEQKSSNRHFSVKIHCPPSMWGFPPIFRTIIRSCQISIKVRSLSNFLRINCFLYLISNTMNRIKLTDNLLRAIYFGLIRVGNNSIVYTDLTFKWWISLIWIESNIWQTNFKKLINISANVFCQNKTSMKLKFFKLFESFQMR